MSPAPALACSCLPVIIQDKVQVAFETVLDLPSFSLRIPEADMERVPEILGAVAPERIQAMQQALAAVWRRWVLACRAASVPAGLTPSANALDLGDEERVCMPHVFLASW